MNCLRKIFLIWMILCLSAGAAIAAPNIAVYRYKQSVDIKTLPANMMAGSVKTIDPWISDNAKWPAGKKIALLVHGFPIFNQGKCRNGMIGLAAHLNGIKKYDAIYVIEYPLKQHILETAAALADIVTVRCPAGTKIDIFAHSMGGLVARTVIEYPQVLLGTNNIASKVNHLVTMGTPHNGLSVAETEAFKRIFSQMPAEIGDMKSDGPFMVMLNFVNGKKPKVLCDYYSVVGARSYRPVDYYKGKSSILSTILKKFQDKTIPVHDGLIDATSAGYNLSQVCHSFKKTQLDLNHDYICNHQEVFDAIDNWITSDKWFETASKKPESSTASGPQILLGKTRAEIERTFGITPLALNTANYTYYESSLGRKGNQYFYGSKPAKFYVTRIGFYPYGKKYTFYEPQNKVHAVVINCEYGPYEDKYDHCLKPDQIIPSQIINHKYYGIYKSYQPNTVNVLWYIDNKTYLMTLWDIPSRPMYTTKVVNGKKRCYANKNTFDIHSGYVINFAYVDTTVKFSPTGGVMDGVAEEHILYIDGDMWLMHCLGTFYK